MTTEGPQLESLLNHLSQCPEEFLLKEAKPGAGPQLAAIMSDYFRSWKAIDATQWIEQLLNQEPANAKSKRHYCLLSVAVWLLFDDWISTKPELKELSWKWLQNDSLKQLSTIVSADKFVTDPDRREELMRLCLTALNLRPSGETVAQSQDRTTTLDSLHRQRILAATAAAEKRAREVREAMAQAKALEAANRYGE